MIEYELGCVVGVTSGNQLAVSVQILRSVDGGPFEEVASFFQEVNPQVADSQILIAIRNRFEEYCKADSDLIDKEDLEIRAEAIETSMDGIRFTP